ncbi:hypothetical protein ACMA1D_02045 [Streptomyces sp. 796.1]|uniref:hypothetical protein n=1 Tax=Streptomyces sp. 796.1 TaxID=3163029 RepID=UPI0039C9F01F
MPYVYRCEACRASAPPRAWQDQARADRDEHRERAHHGLIPDDGITRTGPPAGPRPPSELWRAVRTVGSTDYLRQAAVLLGAGVLVVMALAAILH